MKMTLNTMDKAREYIQVTGETTFKIHANALNWNNDKYWASIDLAIAISQDNPDTPMTTRDEFASEVLAKVAELMMGSPPNPETCPDYVDCIVEVA